MLGQDPGGPSGVPRGAREVDIRSTWDEFTGRRSRRRSRRRERGRGRTEKTSDDMLVDSPPDLPEGCGLPHARSLLPFLLSGVADEVEANGVNALALVESVGAANDAPRWVSKAKPTEVRGRNAGPDLGPVPVGGRRRRSRRRSRAGRPRLPGGSSVPCSRPSSGAR